MPWKKPPEIILPIFIKPIVSEQLTVVAVAPAPQSVLSVQFRWRSAMRDFGGVGWITTVVFTAADVPQYAHWRIYPPDD